MKRRITFSLVLKLSVLLSLASFTSTAEGQPTPGDNVNMRKFVARSGVVPLPATQMLRVTVVPTGSDPIRVRIAWTQYMPAGCSGMPPVCRHTVASQGATAVETLGTDDALSFDVPVTGGGVNVTVSANSRNARALGIVFDAATQQINAICTFIPD